MHISLLFFFFSSRRRHTRFDCDWSSDVCSSDLLSDFYSATALCCTSDLTVAEFKSLKGKMDASNPNARTAQEFLGGTPNWRTDLYSTGATVDRKSVV